MNLYKEIFKLREGGVSCALCTIIEVKGSTPRKVGAKMIVKEDASIIGSVGGGNLEKKVIENSIKQIKENESKVFKHDLLQQHNMCCGGTVHIFIEPIKPMNKLYIFGAGHTGKALAQMAVSMDFEVYVIDDRKEYMDAIEIQGINKMLTTYANVLPALPFDENTYVVIMTYDHAYDRDILGYCVKKPHAYLGMIGSQRKVKLTKKMFEKAEVASKKELENVDMPMGINIYAEEPEEIAVSILAKLIETKNG